MYKSTGFISFFLRRFTGVALVLYLFLHMWVIGSIMQGVEVFDARMEFLQGPVFKVMEVALLAAVVYHAFDGLRLLLVNWFNIADYRKSMFYAVFAISALLTIVGGVPIIMVAIQGH
jgi:succinate dehydrogenase / fumarate reductase cytochrome b subunit